MMIYTPRCGFTKNMIQGIQGKYDAYELLRVQEDELSTFTVGRLQFLRGWGVITTDALL